uniref:Uncharacterized protein n=1 Tax=Pelusios castaneus TaxID=367368 RepID=A0A8C8SB78_9SAUR
MSQRCLWLICLLLMSSGRMLSLDCNQFHQLQREYNWTAQHLLQRMGGKSPVECLEDKTAFRFPEKVLKPKLPQHAMMAVHEILQQHFGIFSRDLSQTGWESRGVQRFLNGLALQIERLETCLPTKRWTNILKLKRYFQRIQDYLKKKKYSKCAWEIVRKETEVCFQYVDKLTMRMKN